MIRIITASRLAALKQQAEDLRAENEGLRHQAGQAEEAARSARSDAGTARRLLDEEHGRLRESRDRAAGLERDLSRAENRLQELRDACETRTSREQAPPDPDDAVIVAVNPDPDAMSAYAAEHGLDLDGWGGQQKARDGWTADQKAKIAGRLAPVVTVMQSAGLIGAGFRIALASDLQPFTPGYGNMADESAAHRLAMAREHILDALGTALLPLPDTFIVLNKTNFIPLFGLEAQAQELKTWHADLEIR